MRFFALVSLIVVVLFIGLFYSVRVQQPANPSFSTSTLSGEAEIELRRQVAEALRNPNPGLRRTLEEQGHLFPNPAERSPIEPASTIVSGRSTTTVETASVVPQSSQSSAPSAASSGSPSSAGARALSADPAGEVSTTPSRYVADRSRRPAWVNASRRYDSEVDIVTVASGPCATPRSAMEKLDQEIMQELSNYAERTYGIANVPSSLGFTADEIRARCLRGEVYVEHGELTGIGPMQELFARLEFDAEFRRELGERWRSLTVVGRLTQIGYIGGAVLLVVALARFVLGKPSNPSEAAIPNLATPNSAPSSGQTA
jgi:hypothetical protein